MVYHVFSDGSVKTDIQDHVVKISDVPQFYDLIATIEKRSVIKTHKKKEVSI